MKRLMGVIVAFTTLVGLIPNAVQASTDDGSVVFYEDFDNMEVGSSPESSNSKISVTNNLNSSVSVQTDSESGSKALKIVSAEGLMAYNGFYVSLGEIKSGILVCDFKIRLEKSSMHLERLRFAKGYSGRIDTKNYNYLISDGQSNITLCSLEDKKYKSFHYEINFDEGTYSVSVNGGNKIESSMKSTDIDTFEMYTSANVASPGWACNDEGESIYWIDDISFSLLSMHVEKSNISNKEENVSVEKKAELEFNTDILKSSVNQTTVKLYENGKALEYGELEVIANKNKLSVSPVNGFNYNREYKLLISKNIRPAEDGVQPMGENFETVFKTERLFPAIEEITQNGKYSSLTPAISPVASVDLAATLKCNEDEAKPFVLGTKIDKIGKYILEVTGTNTQNSKTQTDIYEFEIVGATAPEAQNVIISCADEEIRKGSVLKAEYTYYDVNFDKEGASRIQWYCSKSKDGEYTPLGSELEKNGTLTIEDNDLYYKFSVIPVAEQEPEEGERVFSQSFTGAFLPKAEDVLISGTGEYGEKISVSWFYSDVNGEKENNGTIFRWYRSTDGGKNYNLFDEGDKSEYTIGESDADALIKAGVVPCKGEKTKVYGTEVQTVPMVGPKSPEAVSVKINGSVKVGQAVYVSYVYSDVNNDSEGESVIRWYCNGAKIAEGRSLTITNDMSGKSIYAEVTPVAVKFPFNGKAVRSNEYSVSGESVKPKSGGGGGGGGGSGTVNINKNAISGITAGDNNTKTDENNDEQTAMFSDIYRHWAKDSIERMAKKEIVFGVTKTEFMPDAPIKRAEAAQLIARIFKLKESEENLFEDINGEWYQAAAGAVAKMGFMNGSNGKFRPGDYITREEIAVVLKNIADYYQIETKSEASQTDIFNDVSAWASEAMKFAYKKGFISGMPDGKLYPKNNATRAQFVVLIERFTDFLAENDKGSTEEVTADEE